MASIFTYDPNPPRVSSPWSTPKSTTPKLDISSITTRSASPNVQLEDFKPQVLGLRDVGITRLDPEPQEGPTEYKLHLLLRPRTSAAASAGVAALFGNDESRVGGRSRSPQLELSSPVPRSSSTPSIQTRQNRLQHLTTQLLWRLQQSSPFHSSSSANLVLPLLPEATPRLGVPSKPAHLLPGLEESQGALYEIGVADDGTFVGLNDDEMQESLTNLRAMAASLGCHVEVLRKVLVGRFQPTVGTSSSIQTVVTEDLWVVEALVRPDLGEKFENHPATQKSGLIRRVTDPLSTDLRHSEVEQIRISLVGASAVGKSTLLGVLTSSVTDNGRGKSRLSLLKHRHEVSSGITSSVAQELIGYLTPSSESTATQISDLDEPADVVNYGLSNVASWNDIHSITGNGRLAFVSDSPGLPRFSKSSIRTLVSWKPHWTILCVSATGDGDHAEGLTDSKAPEAQGASANGTPLNDVGTIELSLSYLHMCLKLGLPLVLAMTKMDLASKGGLRTVLGQVLSVLKAAGRKPIILPASNIGVTPDLQSRGSSQLGHDASLRFTQNASLLLQSINDADNHEISSIVQNMREIGDPSIVPIVLISSVTGMGIGKVHALLRALPTLSAPTLSPTPSRGAAISSPPSTSANARGSSALFTVDEIFSMPVSKVFSPVQDSTVLDHSIVICGHLAKGSIGVGEELSLGPFGTIGSLSTGQGYPNEEGYFRARNVDRSTNLAATHTWAAVRVISIRNLRLPVRCLLGGQVGTLGIVLVKDSIEAPVSLAKARRGMILASSEVRNRSTVYSSFSAQFSLEDFEDPNSPPLLIGGQAVVYINSIRAPVKVLAVERVQTQDDEMSLTQSIACLNTAESTVTRSDPIEEQGFFGFDGDDAPTSNSTVAGHETRDEETGAEMGGTMVKIVFTFLRWPESFTSGDQILVIPSPSASFSSSAGVNSSSFPANSLEKIVNGDFSSNHAAITNGLAGFVGSVV